MQDVIKGTTPTGLPRPNRTFTGGRVCGHEGCTTRISVYNRSDLCWAHTPERFPVARGDRRRKVAA